MLLLSNLKYFLIDAGSKEEAFFDSQLVFESDCEDDFFSVNGGKYQCMGQMCRNLLFLLFCCQAFLPHFDELL